MDFLVADDPEQAFERILPHRTHQLNSYRQQALSVRDGLLVGSQKTRFERAAAPAWWVHCRS